MTTKPTEQAVPVEDRNAFLEKQLIEEYLHEKGYSGLMLVDKKSSSVIWEFLLKETQHAGGRCNDKRLQRFLYLDVCYG